MREFQIAVLPGDGIGAEVIEQAVHVLRRVEERLEDVRFFLEELPAGAGEYLRSGDPLPGATMEACRRADAILLGAMGLPEVRRPNGTEIAPQLDLREQLDLYAGIRPVRLYQAGFSPLKGHDAGSIDLVIVRENTEGMFASRHNTFAPDAKVVVDSLGVSRHGVERIARAAFGEARRRRKLCTLVDKANVLPSMAFFRRVFLDVAREFPDVRAECLYVDAAALHLVQHPERFDVLVMENLFGDILSDLAAGLVGGMGMAPSADVGDKHGLFQPSHGTAPDIAGQGVANPVAAILSVALMLDWLAGESTSRGAALVRRAVESVLSDPRHRTRDLGGELSTTQLGELIVSAV